MNKCTLLTFLSIGLLLPGTFVLGQNLQVEEINGRQGLSQGYIASLLQDREGFIWIGTKNGLNRYDGRHFKVFTSDPFNPFAISHDFVSALWEHGDFLLVGTNGGGLNIFHKTTQRFYRFPESPPGGGALQTQGIIKIFMDAYGNIWLVDWKTYLDGNIYQIKLPEGFWNRFSTGGGQLWQGVSIRKHSDYVLNKFFISRDRKRLYYCEDGFLVEIDAKTGRETKHPNPGIGHFSTVMEDRRGNIWVSAKGKLIQWSGKDWQVSAIDIPSNYRIVDISDRGDLIAEFSRRILFFQARADGQDVSFGQPQVFYHKDAVTQVIFDKSGNLWIGSDGFGLYKINPKVGRFQTYFKGQSVYSPPFSLEPGTFGFFADVAQGLEISSPAVTHPLVLKKSELPGIGSHARIQKDDKGRYWILWLHNYAQYQLSRISADGRDHRIFALPSRESRPGQTAVDEKGNIWIGLNGKLLRFDVEGEVFTVWSYRDILTFDHDVRALMQMPDGHWWIGSSLGLVEATPDDRGFTFRLWENKPGKINSLLNNDISSLYNDPKVPHVLWIGTKGGGLNRLDTRTSDFFHLTSKTGLPNDVIYGILPDEAGHLWLSSNKGLIRYHPVTRTIKSFTEADGLQSDEFNTWAYARNDDGSLMFGGVNGLNIFKPDAFSDNPIVPRTLITALKVNNHAVSPGDSTGLLSQAIEFTRQLRLPFRKNSISIEFAALEFTAPQKNRFRYFLEGAEEAWIHEGSENSAQYLNLAPGSYTFRVKGSNNDGVWSESPASLQIVVMPPWYRTWWAYLVYAALVAGLGFAYFRFRLRQLQLQQKLTLEHKEADRIRELDQFKTRLYTNITHEFRTPLTVILGTGEHLEKLAPGDRFEDLDAANRFAQDLKSKLAFIRKNGNHLLDLITQLLDLAKVENNQLKVNAVQGDLVHYIRYIAESFQSLANYQNVIVKIESGPRELIMDYDPEKLRQILSNLLSNALKYTPSGGRVTVQINHSSDVAVIQVSDTGQGIPAEDLPFVFDRFYQSDNTISKAGGTGIGLALTRELVKLLGGKIEVESQIGVGTTFAITLPVTRQAPESADIQEASDLPVYQVEANHPSPLAGENTGSRANSAPPPRLLVIEDNPDVAEFLRLGLTAQYQLLFAYNGRIGVEKALETTPDLILSDVMMPEKDGLEVCDLLKNDERTSHIPIVLLTAKADIESRIAGLRRGADAYLAKPFHQEELQVILEKLLESRRRLQARYSARSLNTPIAEDGTSTPETAVEDAFLAKLRQAIEERLGDADLTVEDVGRAVGMGRSNLYAKLSALTGMSFNVYMRSLRLRKAKELLSTTGMNVSEVAWEVGFNDPKYFSRVFSEEFGRAPSEMKKK